jgi:hypothetical protein
MASRIAEKMAGDILEAGKIKAPSMAMADWQYCRIPRNWFWEEGGD